MTCQADYNIQINEILNVRREARADKTKTEKGEKEMRKMKSGRITAAFAALTLVLAAFSAQAVTFYVTDDGNYNWTDTAAWSTGVVPNDPTPGTVDRVSLAKLGTITVNSTVDFGGAGSEDVILHQYGTVDVTAGGTLNVAQYYQQTAGGDATLRVSGGTVNFSSTKFGNVTGGNFTSRIDMVSGTVTFGADPTVAYGATTFLTQSGGTFNSSGRTLSMANSPGEVFNAVISGGTFNSGTSWKLNATTLTVNMTIDGDNQTAVNLGNLTALAGNAINLRFNLESGWNTKTALGAWNLDGAATKTLSVDFGTLASGLVVGDTITLATATALPSLTGVTLTSLTSGITFNNVSDASGLKIQVTAIPEPATIGMLGLGALATLLLRRMRTR